MATFLLRRLAGMTFVMFVVSFLTYFIFFKLPGGDPAVRLALPEPAVHDIGPLPVLQVDADLDALVLRHRIDQPRARGGVAETAWDLDITIAHGNLPLDAHRRPEGA